MSETPNKLKPKWSNPAEIIQQMKLKKRALQARISGNVFSATPSGSVTNSKRNAFDDVLTAKKRKNPFLKETTAQAEGKKFKPSPAEESTDQTLFKLLHQNDTTTTNLTNSLTTTSFNNILLKSETQREELHVVKAAGEPWLPIDWSLKTRVRLLSSKPFPWTGRLKISEESSGVLSYVRCLKPDNEQNSLDVSPNARFYQCSLYWQHPSLPWLPLFPRSNKTSASGGASFMNQTIRDSLQTAWMDSFKSLFQLIRTRQCPYFYCCSNSFTVLFRAAGINGFGDAHALITPTTRGFRGLLKREDIEFSMPLKKKRASDCNREDLKESDNDSALPDENNDEDEEEEEPADEEWLKGMGIDDEDIKQINYTQAKIAHKAECLVDNSEESTVLVEGCEVHALYNFLINCKSATPTTGVLAGIPPTLLAPVAFNGATLRNLKVRENKVHLDGANFHSLELLGPVLPTMMHDLFAINPPEHDTVATFVTVSSTVALTKVNSGHSVENGGSMFGKENLRDCGLNSRVLKHFCAGESKIITAVECLKYTGEDKTFTWT